MYGEQLFKFQKNQIPNDAQVIFVADMFVEDYVGGAELTTQALIDSSQFKIHKIKSRELTLELLQQGFDKFWVFGNFTQIDSNLIPSIISNLKYSILEYDYKFCRFRSPEKHYKESNIECNCHNELNGKLVSAFYFGAMCLWWMSQKQKEKYFKHFPFLAERTNIVLSSVFDKTTLGLIENLRNTTNPSERKGWIVLGSNSWIKGANAAEQWCINNSKNYTVVWDMPYHDLLQTLAKSEGFVYLPLGGDTCPRMVIEAKLLGCELVLNENVEHKDEEWFDTDDLQSIKDMLYIAPNVFWSTISKLMEYSPSISGYSTTYNCLSQQYPFVNSIKSMLSFCDEVCVVDGGSTDGTWEKLSNLAQENPKLKLKQISRDWSHPRHSVYDGLQKAEARNMCTKEYCWQMDSDEIVHEDDASKIVNMCRILPPGVDILSLPVIEFWGGQEKVRADIQPWKWRLSRNKSDITHGIPKNLRTSDSEGHLMALEGTDGCDMISKETGEALPHISFYTMDVENVRRQAVNGNVNALKEYENWFNAACSQLPSVFHYSWFDLPRKIKLYRDYWQNHWNGLWGKDTTDSAQNNMMFDVPWSQVTDEMIESRSLELKEKLGGWIWHQKWDGKTITPHITVNRSQPNCMLNQ